MLRDPAQVLDLTLQSTCFQQEIMCTLLALEMIHPLPKTLFLPWVSGCIEIPFCSTFLRTKRNPMQSQGQLHEMLSHLLSEDFSGEHPRVGICCGRLRCGLHVVVLFPFSIHAKIVPPVKIKGAGTCTIYIYQKI